MNILDPLIHTYVPCHIPIVKFRGTFIHNINTDVTHHTPSNKLGGVVTVSIARVPVQVCFILSLVGVVPPMVNTKCSLHLLLSWMSCLIYGEKPCKNKYK